MKSLKQIYKDKKEARRLKKEQSDIREPNVLQAEYARISSLVGVKTYQKFLIDAEIQHLNEELFKINMEHDKAMQIYPPEPLPEPSELNTKATEELETQAAYA